MKKIFTCVALGAVSIASANQYYQSQGGGYYQSQPYYQSSDSGSYYQNQPSYPSGGSGYYQSQPSYQSSDSSYYYQSQPSYQSGGSGSWQSQPSYQSSDSGYYYSSQPSYQSGGSGFSQSSQPSYQASDSNYYYQSQPSYQSQGSGFSGTQPSYQSSGTQNFQSQPSYSYGSSNPMQSNPTTSTQQMNTTNGSSMTNQGTAADTDLRKRIQDRLNSGWFSKGFQSVTIDVRNGIITLRGTVDTTDDKNKVEESVKKMEGVKQVNNQINVSKESADAYSDTKMQMQSTEDKSSQDYAATAQDKQINAKIREKLRSFLANKGFDTLIIKTTNGFVIISGNVDRMEDVQKIKDQAKEIEGVKSVSNQVTAKNR